MKLSLQKLRWTLANYQFHPQRASDVVELIRYSYKHTMDFEQGRDKLRGLVLDYIVCFLGELAKEATFLGLLSEQSALGRDLTLKMARLLL